MLSLIMCTMCATLVFLFVCGQVEKKEEKWKKCQEEAETERELLAACEHSLVVVRKMLKEAELKEDSERAAAATRREETAARLRAEEARRREEDEHASDDEVLWLNVVISNRFKVSLNPVSNAYLNRFITPSILVF